MKELLIYISQTSLSVLCAYVVYKAIFARDAFHVVKRLVLLFMVTISFALPLFKITIHKVVEQSAINETLINNVTPNDDLTDVNWQVMGPEDAFDWILLTGIIYLAGVVTMLIYSLIGVLKVNAIIKKSTQKHTHDGIEVLLVHENIPAFSYRNKIVISYRDYDEDSDIIIKHETIHIKQRHSADLRFVNLALSLQWFNPLMWLIKRELVLTHEFCADQGVIKSGIDAKIYQYLLISKSASSQDFIPVVNHFRSSDLRKRIMTMKKNRVNWHY